MLGILTITWWGGGGDWAIVEIENITRYLANKNDTTIRRLMFSKIKKQTEFTFWVIL